MLGEIGIHVVHQRFGALVGDSEPLGECIQRVAFFVGDGVVGECDGSGENECDLRAAGI